jgi:hypothetical protein
MHRDIARRSAIGSEQTAAIEVATQVPLVSSVRNELVISGAARPIIALARPALAADEPNLDATPVRA